MQKMIGIVNENDFSLMKLLYGQGLWCVHCFWSLELEGWLHNAYCLDWVGRSRQEKPGFRISFDRIVQTPNEKP